ncbi:MAG: hypothetical protein AAF630_09705 [Cyanobacteria bacterium P01_C01_bin.38]
MKTLFRRLFDGQETGFLTLVQDVSITYFLIKNCIPPTVASDVSHITGEGKQGEQGKRR